MMELSVEDLYAYKRCPLQYKWLRIDRIQTDFQMSIQDGFKEAIHTTIRYFYLNLRDGRLLSAESLKKKFQTIWEQKIDLYQIRFDEIRTKRKKELEGIGLILYFHKQQSMFPDDVIDVAVDFHMPFGPDLNIKGTIPLIRSTHRGQELVQFKTADHIQSEFWSKTDMELTLYALAYQSMYQKPPDSIAIYYVKTGTTIFTSRAPVDYQRLYQSIKLLKKGIQEQWFYPRESYSCDQCPVQSLCMNWRGAV